MQREADGPVAQYCGNIADAAREARYEQQRKHIAELEAELQHRFELLDEKIAAYQRWVGRRDEFVDKARDGVVLVFGRMKPEAAARQLSEMDEEMAAAIIVKLQPRNASAILSDMDPARAARLASLISKAARSNEGKKP